MTSSRGESSIRGCYGPKTQTIQLLEESAGLNGGFGRINGYKVKSDCKYHLNSPGHDDRAQISIQQSAAGMPRSLKRSAVYGAFMRHEAPLKRFVSRFLRSSQDIEDIVQEAFLRAYRAEADKEIEQPKSYLFRIAKHLALTQLSRKSRQITDYLEDCNESIVTTASASVEDEFIANQTLGMHCEAVAALPPQCRRVYLMRKVYGMTHKEIAERLGIAVSTVEKHLIKGVAECDRFCTRRIQMEQDTPDPDADAHRESR